MLQLANRGLAVDMFAFEAADHTGGLGCQPLNQRKQQAGLERAVETFGQLVDVEQHRSQHIEEAVGVVLRPAIDHHHNGLQYRSDRCMLVADDSQAVTRHGHSLF
jgi:hypothetical protein